MEEQTHGTIDEIVSKFERLEQRARHAHAMMLSMIGGTEYWSRENGKGEKSAYMLILAGHQSIESTNESEIVPLANELRKSVFAAVEPYAIAACKDVIELAAEIVTSINAIDDSALVLRGERTKPLKGL